MAIPTHNITIFSNGSLDVQPLPVVTVPKPSNYWMTLEGWKYATDYKARGWSIDYPNLPDKGFPDMVDCRFSGFMKVTPDLKKVLHNLIESEGIKAGMSKTEIDFAFSKIYDSGRFLSNGHGVESGNFMIQGLTCGRNIVHGLREDGNWLIVEAFDYRAGIPIRLSPAARPDLFHEARTETMENGINVSNRFHWLKGYPVFFPFLVKSDPANSKSKPGEQWIEKRKLRRLLTSELPDVLIEKVPGAYLP